MPAGRWTPKLWVGLNLTRPDRSSNLKAYVKFAPSDSPPASPAGPAESRDSGSRSPGARGGVCHAHRGTSQRCRGHPRPRLLRAVSARHRSVAEGCWSSRHGPCSWCIHPTRRAVSGRIAQLVQSACLTRRMSGVRIPLRPLEPARRAWQSLILRDRSFGEALECIWSVSSTLTALAALATAPLASAGHPARRYQPRHGDRRQRAAVHGREPVRVRAGRLRAGRGDRDIACATR